MKKIVALVLAVLMVVGCVAVFSACTPETKTIKIGLSGPFTGGAAVYGLAVKNSAQLAIDEINAKGGLNGVMLELKALDDVNNPSNINTNYAELLDWGMQVSLGCVTTQPALAFAALSKEDNIFFLTPSASADAVRENDNGFQMCFADKKQGVAAAEYVASLNLSKIGVFYQSDIDYSKGIRDEFVAKLTALCPGIEIEEASFTESTKSDFTTQVSNLSDCGFIFMPIYYQEAALFMNQAKTVTTIETYYGCDGFDGLTSVLDVESIPQKISMLTHFNSTNPSTAAATYIANYTAKYGTETLNQFGASAYDCVYAIFAAMKLAAEEGNVIDADTSASDVCNILKAIFTSETFTYTGAVTGATGSVKWTADGFVNKEAIAERLDKHVE